MLATMMATTHVFAGLVVASLVAVLAPQFAVVVAVAAIVGGLLPDLDLVGEHRKTLHFPVYYSLCAVLAAIAAVLVPTPATVGLAVGVTTAGLHSVMDHVGGGLEREPWQATTDRAVYSHYHRRWLPPRRWIGYDGSPGDLALASVLALPALFVFDGTIYAIVTAMLGVSIGYTVFRKPIARAGEWFPAAGTSAIKKEDRRHRSGDDHDNTPD